MLWRNPRNQAPVRPCSAHIRLFGSILHIWQQTISPWFRKDSRYINSWRNSANFVPAADTNRKQNLGIVIEMPKPNPIRNPDSQNSRHGVFIQQTYNRKYGPFCSCQLRNLFQHLFNWLQLSVVLHSPDFGHWKLSVRVDMPLPSRRTVATFSRNSKRIWEIRNPTHDTTQGPLREETFLVCSARCAGFRILESFNDLARGVEYLLLSCTRHYNACSTKNNNKMIKNS